MISAETYLDHVKAAGERIARVAEGHLDEPVPTCPGNTVGSLLLHTAGVCMFWADALEQNREPVSDWTTFPTEPVQAHRRMHGRVVAELEGRDPDQPTWTWAGEGRVRFAYRRVAQELTVHRWDFENAVGEPQPIEPALAADGIDELLVEFGTKSTDQDTAWKTASELFDGGGERICLEATDIPAAWTITARPGRFDITHEPSDADVSARGTASDLLLFLWGRVPPRVFEVSGDASLLDRWQERVKI